MEARLSAQRMFAELSGPLDGERERILNAFLEGVDPILQVVLAPQSQLADSEPSRSPTSSPAASPTCLPVPTLPKAASDALGKLAFTVRHFETGSTPAAARAVWLHAAGTTFDAMERCGRVVAVALDQLTERQTDEAAQKNGAIEMAELWGRTGRQIRAWIAEESGAG